MKNINTNNSFNNNFKISGISFFKDNIIIYIDDCNILCKKSAKI